MKRRTLILLAATLATFSACKKEVTQVTEVDQAFSRVYDIMPEDWTTSDNGLSYSASFDVPEISDAVFDHGAVMVYLSFVDGTYEALPEVYEGFSYGAIHGSGGVTVDIYALDGGTFDPPTGEIYAKVVLIDATALSMHPGINLRDYNTLKSTFHLH